MFVQTHHHPSHHGVIVLAFSLLITQFATAQPPPPVLRPPPPSYTFSPSMATAVIVLIIFFFCIGFISVYVRHLMTCLGIHLGSESLEVQAWRRNRQSRGLDPAIVDNFPTFLYSDVKTHRIGKSSLECAICLNEFTDLELLRLLPSCCHVFHPHCIGPWLASHVTCPVCRANLESHSSRRSLSFNYLANNQFDQSSSDDESSVEPSNHHNRDVIVRLGVSPQDNMAIKSPAAALQEIKRADSLTGKLLRSHSTGHSLVEDCERYTLRLPDEVRNKLVNINNSSGLPAAIDSPRVGYRARSIGCTKTDGTKPDHWRFSVSPPFISRSNSTKSPKSDSENSNNNNNNNSGGIMSGPRSLFKSIKLSPSLNRVTRSDDSGDRSTNRLWDNRTTQDLELEAQWHQNH